MRARTLIRLLLLVALATAGSPGAASAERLAVIVHAERSTVLGLEDVAQIYLKRRRYWSGGESILPINRESGSEARARFSRVVLRMDESGLAVYWNRAYFQGVLPPATLASDEAILRFVSRERRAIGYVDERVIDESVRVVLYID